MQDVFRIPIKEQLVTRSNLQRLRCCVCHLHHEQALRAPHRVRQVFAQALKKVQHHRVDVVVGGATAAAYRYQQEARVPRFVQVLGCRHVKRKCYGRSTSAAHFRADIIVIIRPIITILSFARQIILIVAFMAILSWRRPLGPRIVRELWSNTCERTRSEQKGASWGTALILRVLKSLLMAYSRYVLGCRRHAWSFLSYLLFFFPLWTGNHCGSSSTAVEAPEHSRAVGGALCESRKTVVRTFRVSSRHDATYDQASCWSTWRAPTGTKGYRRTTPDSESIDSRCDKLSSILVLPRRRTATRGSTNSSSSARNLEIALCLAGGENGRSPRRARPQRRGAGGCAGRAARACAGTSWLQVLVVFTIFQDTRHDLVFSSVFMAFSSSAGLPVVLSLLNCLPSNKGFVCSLPPLVGLSVMNRGRGFYVSRLRVCCSMVLSSILPRSAAFRVFCIASSLYSSLAVFCDGERRLFLSLMRRNHLVSDVDKCVSPGVFPGKTWKNAVFSAIFTFKKCFLSQWTVCHAPLRLRQQALLLVTEPRNFGAWRRAGRAGRHRPVRGP